MAHGSRGAQSPGILFRRGDKDFGRVRQKLIDSRLELPAFVQHFVKCKPPDSANTHLTRLIIDYQG